MKRIVIDTNVLLRYLVGDIFEQMEEAKKLFRKAEQGEVKLVLLPVIVAEASYVLVNYYQKTESDVADLMNDLLSPSWWEIEHKEALLGMWGDYRRGLHFVDSYLIALRKYEGLEVMSFDKQLIKNLS